MLETIFISNNNAIVNKTKGSPSTHAEFANYTPDFADAAVISAFENAFPGSEQTVSLSIEDTLPTLSREGYKFMGWGNGIKVFEEPFADYVTKDMKFVAVWEETVNEYIKAIVTFVLR